MATTSLWAIKGRIDHLINYVENPEKTSRKSADKSDPQELWNIMIRVNDYVTNPDKTDGKVFVSGLNCIPERAIEQFIMTKKQFGKEDKILAFHGFQSFKPGEVSPDIAHEIGVEYAKEMWGDRFQVIITTHLDCGHIHNHFAFNSVSFKDGKKYNLSKDEHRRKIRVSDRLCRFYDLSVIQSGNSKAAPRMIHLAEKNGEMTRNNIIKDDIDFVVSRCQTMPGFLHSMEYLGYESEVGQYLSFKIQGDTKSVFTYHLGAEYTYQSIYRRIIENYRIKPKVYVTYKKVETYPSYIIDMQRFLYNPKTAPLAAIYYLLLLSLLIVAFPILKINCSINSTPEQRHYIHPLMRLEIRKLDNIIEQASYMEKYKIGTMDDLIVRHDGVKAEMDSLITRRNAARNSMKKVSITPEEYKKAKLERDRLSFGIKRLRKEIGLCNGIREWSIYYAEKNKLQEKHEEKMENYRSLEIDVTNNLVPIEAKIEKRISVRKQLNELKNASTDRQKTKDYER